MTRRERRSIRMIYLLGQMKSASPYLSEKASVSLTTNTICFESDFFLPPPLGGDAREQDVFSRRYLRGEGFGSR